MANGTPGRKKLPPDLTRPRASAVPYNQEWLDWQAEMTEYMGYEVCGSKSRKQYPCPQPRVPGRSRCRNHGGLTLRGPDHPNWQHGQASIFRELLPARMADVFDAAVNDPERLSLATDLALAVVAQQQALTPLRDGVDPAAAVRQAREHLSTLRLAVAEQDWDKVGATTDSLAATLDAGADTAAALDRVLEVAERKRKLADTERKRMESLQAYISAEEARARDQMLTAIVVRAADQHIPSPQDRARYLRAVMEGILALSGGDLHPLPHGAQRPGHGPATLTRGTPDAQQDSPPSPPPGMGPRLHTDGP